MQTMYPAFVNSPETVTLGAISPTDTTVTVQDITKIPVPPNLLVIGGDRPDAETVLLTAVSGSTLTIQRAVNGTARTWADRTTIARNFTAYDHDAFKANIEELNTGKLDIGGNGSNVTAAFTQAASKLNIASGEKLSVIFGKLMKWFADLGAAAWMGTGTTASTVALGNHTHTAAAVGAVPTSRKVNGKALSADVTLLMEDISGLIAVLADKAPAGYGLGGVSQDVSNLNWLDILAQNKGGWYSGSNVANAPTTIDGGTGWYTFIINPFPDILNSEQYQTCIAISSYYNKIYFGRRYGGVWSGWMELAHNIAPVWYTPTMASGFTAHGNNKYGKNGAGIVHLFGAISKATTPVASEAILTLPIGFRPAQDITVPLIGVSGWSTFGYLKTDGNLIFSGLIPPGYTSGQQVVFNALFLL